MKKQLVIFTLQYPDPLMDKELSLLANAFDNVYLLPQKVVGDVYLPSGVELHTIFKSTNLKRPIRLILKHFFQIIRIFGWTLIMSPHRKRYIAYFKSFIGYLLIELEKIEPIENFIKKRDLQFALFYDFWLVNSTIALADLKRKKRIHVSVARAHGFDLYHERQYEKHVSFQEYRMNYLDRIFTVSKHGYRYLQNVTLPSLRDKIKLSYLGTLPTQCNTSPKKINKQYTIVTCSSIIKLKRVDLIARVLHKCSLPIQWVHFGDGPLSEHVVEIARTFPQHIQWEWRGNRPNKEVLDFYRNNYVDLFLSLSNYEGLPVSMMEAIQFGIPIMACSIFGVPEIVTNQTGVLVDVDAREEILVDTLEKTLLANSFNRIEIQNFYKTHFNYERNIKFFIEELAFIYPPLLYQNRK